MRAVLANNRKVFVNSITFIAEAGVNHNGDLGRALEMVFAAKEAGADVIKFQAFTTENTVSASAPTAAYQARNTGVASQYEMIRALELSWDMFAKLAEACKDAGIEFLATPFDWMMTERLLDLGMPAIKVASGEATNTVALKHFARFDKPLWLSTGMCTLGEVSTAIGTLRSEGCEDITVMHCTSIYPAPLESLNLKALSTLSSRFGLPIGYSDHSLGDQASLAAVAMGAVLIEKHFTLDKSLPGPDHAASLDVPELSSMIERIRQLEVMLGTGRKEPFGEELATAKIVRRSWHTSRAVAAGAVFEMSDLRLIRPATGLAPDACPAGQTARHALDAGTPITADDLA